MIVTDAHGDFVRVTTREILKCLFQHRRTAAQQYELHVRRKHFLQGAEQEIAALLVHQPADVAEKWSLWRRRQSEFPLQRQFDGFLSPKIAHGEWVRQKRVFLGSPFRVIHAVQDSDDRMSPPSQDAIEPTAERFG